MYTSCSLMYLGMNCFLYETNQIYLVVGSIKFFSFAFEKRILTLQIKNDCHCVQISSPYAGILLGLLMGQNLNLIINIFFFKNWHAGRSLCVEYVGIHPGRAAVMCVVVYFCHFLTAAIICLQKISLQCCLYCQLLSSSYERVVAG